MFLGLGRDMLQWIERELAADTSRRPARYVGAPSPLNDWGNLYRKQTLNEAVRLIAQEVQSSAPHRIFVLYVPSRDDQRLVASLGIVCYLAPLKPDPDAVVNHGNPIAWRHDKAVVQVAVQSAIRQAWKTTNGLKAEITDKRICALSLPARNFYYPDSDSTISDTYQEFAQHSSDPLSLRDALAPTRFDRKQLHHKAFKGQQYTDRFFQDCRGRVFPPDPYHAPNRTDSGVPVANSLPLAVRQRYRFGVTVRDGNLHYDVQFETPIELKREPMYCAVEGDVWVTGSHANVGVNDFVWVPSGTKERRGQK